MIVFIDDEKWIIKGIIDYFENKCKLTEDSRWNPKHFFSPVEVEKFISYNISDINLFIIDIGMEYGDGDLNKEISGGVHLVNILQTKPTTKHIPIIILSIHNLNYFESDLIHPIDNKLLFYVNRNDDANNDLLYPLIDKIINNKSN
ncbi:MAG: hypothetical protein K8R58_02215 [Bacteroidales bacterium]|nr:hypothetical protein [Bacteroidales bacterium]